MHRMRQRSTLQTVNVAKWECRKEDVESPRKTRKFDPSPRQNPLTNCRNGNVSNYVSRREEQRQRAAETIGVDALSLEVIRECSLHRRNQDSTVEGFA